VDRVTAQTKSRLLAEILEHPDDDAPRLVYADLLTGEGDPHGELIVVQCELARLGFAAERPRVAWAADSLGDHDALESGRLDALRRRENELLVENGSVWAAKVHALGFDAGFERGFLERVAYKDARAEAAERPRRHLQPDEFVLDRFFDAAPLLRSLHLGNGMPRPFDSPQLPQLRELSFSLAWIEPGLTACQSLTRLQRVKVNVGRAEHASSRSGGARVRMDGNLRALASAPWFAGLRALGLNDVGLDPALLAEILAGGARLCELHLRGNKLGLEGARVLARSSELSELEILSLHRNAIGPEGTRTLFSSPHVQHLRALNLRKNKVGEVGAAALSALPRLCVLDLSDNDLGARGVSALVSGRGLTQLRDLHLSNAALDDDAAEVLAASPVLASLRHLSLRTNAITDRGIEALAASEQARNLRVLDVRENRLGPSGKAALASSAHLKNARTLM
jgi:uncharacterized protein (TIGR02996 family)